MPVELTNVALLLGGAAWRTPVVPVVANWCSIFFIW
jgi:hypothetical protein